MRKVFLAEATAYDPKENKLVTVRMCSRGQGHIAFSDLPDAEYVPCIITPPQQTVSFNQDGIPGQIQVEYGTLGISFARDLRNTHWRRFDFDGYPCRLLYGDAGSPYSSYTLIPGSKLGALESEENGGSFAIRGPEIDLTKDILIDSYGGGGKADGREDLKGTLKPFAIGKFENWQPVLVDPVNLIYQFHGYGPAGDVSAVYENALTLGPARLVVQSYDELAALTAPQLPPGSWAKAPAVGMFRLGAEPYGKLTLDGIGALDGQVAHTGVASICAFMLRRFGAVPADKIDMASATRLDRTFPHQWGNCVDAQAKPDETQDSQITYSVGDFVREAMAHVAGYLFATPDGVWHFGRNVSAKPPITLRQSRSARPVVLSVGSPATSTRVQRVRVGGRRCFVTHSDNEISSALKDAIETVANDAVEAGKKADEAKKEVAGVRKQLPDIVGPLLQKPIDDLSALHIEYGASLSKAQFALHNKNLVAIREIGTRVEEDGGKLAEEVLQLTSRLTEAEKAIQGIDVDGSIEAGLAEIRRTIANANYATSEAIDLKITNYGSDVSAWQTEEERIRSEKDSALAEEIEEMGVSIRKDVGDDFTVLEGAFNDLRQLVVDSDSNDALALRIDEMGVRITTEVGDEKTAREAAIRTVEKAVIDGDKVQADRIDTLSSSVEGVVGPDGQLVAINGIIQTLQQTQADDNGARALETKNLQSRLDNVNGASLEQTLTTFANKVDGVGASYVLKVQTDQNGQRYIAGMGVAIENGVSAIAFSADSFRLTTPGSNPVTPFYADATGLYAPNLIVEKLKADSIDSVSLKQAASSKTSYAMVASDVACSRGANTTVLSYKFFKEDADSLLKVVMFAQCYHSDDFDFWGDILLDESSVQRAQVRMPFDNSNSRGQAPITPFVFLPNIPAGEHTVSFVIMSNEAEGPTYVRAGSTLEVTELRRASIGTSVGSAPPVDGSGGGNDGGSTGGGSGGDWGGGSGTYQPEVNVQ